MLEADRQSCAFRFPRAWLWCSQARGSTVRRGHVARRAIGATEAMLDARAPGGVAWADPRSRCFALDARWRGSPPSLWSPGFTPRRPRRRGDRTGTRGARPGGDVVTRRQGRVRHLDLRSAKQGLVHAEQRHPQRDLLPAHRHRGFARHSVRGVRRCHVHRPRGLLHEQAHGAGRSARARVPPDQHCHQRQVPHHQDLRHRSGPLGGAGRRPVRVAHRQAISACTCCTTSASG